MSKINGSFLVAAIFGMMLPSVSSAAFSTGGDVLNFFIDVVSAILPILVGMAVIVFFWGLVKFMTHAGNEEAIAEAKQLIVWGLVAVTVMVSFWGLIGFIQESFFSGVTPATPIGDLELSPTHIP